MASRAITDPIEILLEMGVDLDNLSNEEDYLSALMEAAATIEFQTKGSGDERSAALRKEIIKVRKKRKAADPKFKVKKTQISAGAFKKQSSVAKVGRSQKALPGSIGGALARSKPSKGGALVTQGGEDGRGPSILEKILAGVNSILKTLKEDREFKKKLANQERKSAERKKRSAREDKLESGIFKNILKGAKKILKPVEGILGRILKFIGTILIGKVLQKIVAWMSDPKNEGKLEAIGNFLEVTWPAILGAFLVFSTGFGGVITGLIALVARFIPRIAATIVKLAASNPLAAAAIAGAGLFVAGYAIPKLMPGTVDKQEKITEGEPGTTEEKIAKLKEQKKNLSLFQRMQGVGLEIDEQIKFLETGKTAAYSGGGIVRGFAGGGHAMAHGTDTVPAMLTPGEFVMSRGAVQKYGSSTLASMNAAGGGTNRPTMLNGTLYAQTGGHVHKGDRKLQGDPETGNADIDPESGLPMNKPVPVSGTASVVQPTEPLIPKKNKDKDKVANSWKPILDLIAKYEAVGGSYDSIYPSRTKPGLSKMTIAEADSWQASTASSRGSAAAGRYQFMNIKHQAAYAGIGSDAIFSPENQDKMAIALIEKKRKVTYDLMQKNPDEAMIRLGMEWAALPMPKAMRGHKRMVNAGQSYYAGDGKNKAGASIKEVRDAMKGIGPTVGRGSTTDSSSSISSTNGGGSGEDNKVSGGGGVDGLKMLATIMRAQSKLMSSTPTAKIGSQPPPSSPPSPPSTSSPTVTVADSAQQSGANQTPISETVSYVPVIPSAPKDTSKVTVLGLG